LRQWRSKQMPLPLSALKYDNPLDLSRVTDGALSKV
jgi:hypothetical protein